MDNKSTLHHEDELRRHNFSKLSSEIYDLIQEMMEAEENTYCVFNNTVNDDELCEVD